MASHFISVIAGDGLSPGNVTAGTSSSSEAIELQLVDGQSLSKVKVLLGLEAIKRYIERPDTTITA